jgi:hypothetical protein
MGATLLFQDVGYHTSPTLANRLVTNRNLGTVTRNLSSFLTPEAPVHPDSAVTWNDDRPYDAALEPQRLVTSELQQFFDNHEIVIEEFLHRGVTYCLDQPARLPDREVEQEGRVAKFCFFLDCRPSKLETTPWISATASSGERGGCAFPRRASPS